ncbi:DUF7018 domain-containing (lipo)protein [Bacillus cereus group sp. BfR-BA-01383]|uniref:DUF7018 domain-containing (lipo)protein n=1 Tax=Bacillus cereus group sp. BfR-BA-01383 TaxID=2920327 RepID=UPI001F5736FD|nr:hypothetical protein [Bacillus cereus group sp. BfR-BA-01383]
MKRKLLAVALPITLALGVGCSNKDVAEDKKTDSLQVADKDIQEVSKGKEKSETNAEKEYKSKLNSLLADVTKQAPELSAILTSDKPLIEKANEYMEKSEPLKETSDKISALDPGEKYKDVHTTVQKAMYKLKSGTMVIGQGLNLKDDSLVKSGAESMEESSKLLFEADTKLKEIK